MSSTASLKFRRILVDLQKVGFSGHEARIYIALLEKHPATAYEVGKAAGLPHANVYRSLDTLVKKGAAQPVTLNPKRYVAVKPDVLLSAISKSTTSLCEDLTKDLSHWSKVEEIEHVWSLHGEQNTHSTIETMIAGAREYIWIKAHESTLDRHLPALKKAAQRGVKILVIFLGDPSSAKRYALSRQTKVCCHEGTGRSGIGDAHHSLTMTVDLSSALTMDTREGGHGAFTRSPPVVNLANTMIRHELYFAEIFESFGQKIEDKFGPALINLRKNYLPERDVKALEKQLKLSKMRAKKPLT